MVEDDIVKAKLTVVIQGEDERTLRAIRVLAAALWRERAGLSPAQDAGSVVDVNGDQA